MKININTFTDVDAVDHADVLTEVAENPNQLWPLVAEHADPNAVKRAVDERQYYFYALDQNVTGQVDVINGVEALFLHIQGQPDAFSKHIEVFRALGGQRDRTQSDERGGVEGSATGDSVRDILNLLSQGAFSQENSVNSDVAFQLKLLYTKYLWQHYPDIAEPLAEARVERAIDNEFWALVDDGFPGQDEDIEKLARVYAILDLVGKDCLVECYYSRISGMEPPAHRAA